MTNLPPSPSELEYQEYYKEQSKKPYLNEEEFAELQRKGDELLQGSNLDIDTLLQSKIVFALIVSIVAFLSSKYLLSELRVWSGAVTTFICLVSLFWFVSTFELIVYMGFCVIGAFVGQKFNTYEP